MCTAASDLANPFKRLSLNSIKRCLLSVHFWMTGLGIKFESHECLVFVPRNEDLKRKKAVIAYELPGYVW